MNTRAETILQAAIGAGTLPPGAQWPEQEARPWPVVLLTALGAWLAAVPLLAMVALLLGDILRSGAGPYVAGALVLAGAVVALRSREVPLFVEQLAVPALLVGLGSLSFGLWRDLHERGGSAALALLAVLLALGLPQAWLRVLLGAAAGAAATWAFMPVRWDHEPFGAAWWGAWHLSAALCAAGWALQHSRRVPPAGAIALESLLAGWTLAVVAGLAMWSGMSFLVGAGLGEVGHLAQELGPGHRGVDASLPQAASVALSLLAAAALAWCWPSLRSAWWGGVALALGVTAWFLPALGAVLAAAAGCAATQRWRLACAGALAAAWIVGSFYYRLQWPLSTKALVLVAVGVALAALAWASLRGRARAAGPAAGAPGHWGFALGAIVALVVANVSIWQKESLIARGQPVFIELVPVDPRSLMQGDYMRLAFRIPGDAVMKLEGLVTRERPRLVGRRDARGVLALQRLDDGSPLASDELRIELTPKGGRWTVVTDAWFFEEGEAARFLAAKYGEFRVDADGKALLVGLRDAQLKPL